MKCPGRCLDEKASCCTCRKREAVVRLKNCRDEIHGVCQYCERQNPTHAVVASRLRDVVQQEISEIWKKHPEEMLGWDERLGVDGRPEVFVTYRMSFELPDEINGVRIVGEAQSQTEES